MTHQPHPLTFLNPQPGQPTRRWVARGPAEGTAWSVWLGCVALLMVLGLLLVFHAVVTQAVNQSAQRQQARSAQSQAMWRCKQLPGAVARQACLRDLTVPVVNGS